MSWFNRQKKIEERGNYRILCDQNEMDFLNPSDYSDSEQGARAIARYKTKKHEVLTYSVEKKDKRGFWHKI